MPTGMAALCQKKTFSRAVGHIRFATQRAASNFSLIPGRGLALERHHLLATQEARDEVALSPQGANNALGLSLIGRGLRF